MKQWEYMIVDSTEINDRTGLELVVGSANKEAVEMYLNELGSKGWEIVNIDFEDQGRQFMGLAKRRII